MTNFLSSLKADLLDRRLLPLVALVALALVGAIAYAVLGGGSSAATPTAVVSSAPVVPAGLPTSEATHEDAVAETTGGVSDQHKGTARNPFTPLPESKAKTAASTPSTGSAASTTSSSPSSTSSPSSSTTTPSSSTTTPATPVTPPPPARTKIVYHVAVLFGVLPAGATAASAQLTPYENLKLLTPLPSAKQPLIVFRGVTAGGKSATFTLVGEAILHGQGTCLPSATQCEAIDLRAGQAELLEYLPPEGQTVTYELKLVSIASSKGSSAAVKSVLGDESKAGRELLVHAGLQAIPDLRYSSQAGVLVFAAHHAFAARRGGR
jgi:hypothetical protein